MIRGLMVPPLSQTVANFFPNFGQGLSRKVGFFLIFEPILRPGFFDKILALSIKKATFVLVSIIFPQFYSNIIRKVAF